LSNINRNRLHYEFNRNRRLISRLTMEFFALRRQCAMNRGFEGWVSSFIIGEVTVCDVRK